MAYNPETDTFEDNADALMSHWWEQITGSQYALFSLLDFTITWKTGFNDFTWKTGLNDDS